MTQTYLTGLAQEPTLVLDNIVYSRSAESKGSVLLRNNSTVMCFQESQPVLGWENTDMQPVLKRALQETQSKQQQGKQAVAARLQEIKEAKHQNVLEALIAEYLSLFFRKKLQRQDAKPQKRSLSTSSDGGSIDEFTIEIDIDQPFHKTLDSTPVLNDLYQGPGIFIDEGSVFNLQPIQSENGTVIIEGSNKYFLASQTPLAAFDNRYRELLQAKLTERVKAIEDEQEAQFEKLVRIRTEKARVASLRQPQEEDRAGWLKEGNTYYLWLKIKYFILPVKGVDYGFQTCRIGVKLIMHGDKPAFEHKVYLLAAKGIKEGEEIGHIQSMKAKHYMHPATGSAAGGYSVICLGTYPFPLPDREKDESPLKFAARSVRRVLFDASQIFQFNYKTEDDNTRHNTPHRYIEKHPDSFRENVIRKK